MRTLEVVSRTFQAETFQAELRLLMRWARTLNGIAIAGGVGSGAAALAFLRVENWRETSLREVWADHGGLALFLGLSGAAIFSALGWIMHAILKRLGQLERAMVDLATTDPLTHAFNRYRMLEDLEQVHTHSRERRRPYALLMIDLDRFRRINDDFAHAAGDVVLRQVADRIRSSVRSSATLYRYGGEEFVLLLPFATLTQGLEIAERVRAVIESTRFVWLNEHFHITVSVGVAANEAGHRRVLAKVLTAADLALSEAKSAGRNRVMAESPVPVPAD